MVTDPAEPPYFLVFFPFGVVATRRSVLTYCGTLRSSLLARLAKQEKSCASHMLAVREVCSGVRRLLPCVPARSNRRLSERFLGRLFPINAFNKVYKTARTHVNKKLFAKSVATTLSRFVHVVAGPRWICYYITENSFVIK
jgi:hypothetical protein